MLSHIDDLVREISRRLQDLGAEIASHRAARERADDACRRQTRLLGRVSHQLRGPLAALQLQLDRLEFDHDPPTDRNRELMSRMRVSIEKLYQIAEGILEVVRVEGRRMDAPAELVDLRELAAEVIAELGPAAEKKGLGLALECAAALPPVEGDPDLLRLLVHHLADNAVEFTERGSVTLSLAAEDAECSLVVADTGPGIGADECERIFEPFEQGQRGRAAPCRRGLGLTLVRTVAVSLGGSVEVESAPGGGSRFTVRLPASARA